jgi:hypothetical protein
MTSTRGKARLHVGTAGDEEGMLATVAPIVMPGARCRVCRMSWRRRVSLFSAASGTRLSGGGLVTGPVVVLEVVRPDELEALRVRPAAVSSPEPHS